MVDKSEELILNIPCSSLAPSMRCSKHTFMDLYNMGLNRHQVQHGLLLSAKDQEEITTGSYSCCIYLNSSHGSQSNATDTTQVGIQEVSIFISAEGFTGFRHVPCFCLHLVSCKQGPDNLHSGVGWKSAFRTAQAPGARRNRCLQCSHRCKQERECSCHENAAQRENQVSFAWDTNYHMKMNNLHQKMTHLETTSTHLVDLITTPPSVFSSSRRRSNEDSPWKESKRPLSNT